MDFSLEQSFGIIVAIAVLSLLAVSLSQILSMVSKNAEKNTDESAFVSNDINGSILDPDDTVSTIDPVLNVNNNIKINKSKFESVFSETDQDKQLNDILAVIKRESGCSATDYKGNAISSDRIVLQFNNDQKATILNYLKNGGIIEVKFSVEDDKGRKSSTIRNIIINTYEK